MAVDGFYHVIAIRPGDRRKSITNRSEEDVLTDFVIPFVSGGTIKAKWGESTQTYQVLELRIYRTKQAFDRKAGQSLEDFIGSGRNLFSRFEDRAKQSLGIGSYRVFVIMPIQGEKFGTQDEQRIYREFDERFEVVENALAEFDCVAIRIDKEHPLEDLVGAIKKEIARSQFVIADITDERPSCYFEAGYAEARGKQVVYIASKESIIRPGAKTKIHFDVHMNVHFFSNHDELEEKLRAAVEKNKAQLFRASEEVTPGVR
jgi:hypothetical protein